MLLGPWWFRSWDILFHLIDADGIGMLLFFLECTRNEIKYMKCFSSAPLKVAGYLIYVKIMADFGLMPLLMLIHTLAVLVDLHDL
ncbi:hypothetical protein L1987_37724 [Smallanthus sonchifolius]|uniref:Uncharacterized protein n=1 Tax=Smallanthus sonchifolius TaxID=185202 RepID=A0ACB9HIY7_9ASTR|nr:hypothetical protein L1987_37724 [Smallanthus sonchifolius]